jgi:hypothetical protein
MPAPTMPTNIIATDPGFLYWAPLASTEPANTVAGSVFTDAWPGAWIPLGITKEGSEFNWQTTTDKIEAAETLDPLKFVSTGREGSFKFELLNMSASNVKKMLNGGTIVVTGSGATTLSAYTPPALGSEVRCMLGWESLAADERLILRQCFQTGQLTIARKKGADNATLPAEFGLEALANAATQPFSYLTAGTARA